METKQQIRNAYKEKRRLLPPASAAQLSAQIAENLLQWECYRQTVALYLYYPLGNEVSLLQLIRDAVAAGKRVALPKVSGRDMEFYQIFGLEELAEGAFHIMEPQTAGRQPVNWEQALCFIPGVVFDRNGRRYGYGRGYYDRYFSMHSSGMLVGCAYECQVAECLQADAWDRCMDHLVTEKGIYRCRNKERQDAYQI